MRASLRIAGKTVDLAVAMATVFQGWRANRREPALVLSIFGLVLGACALAGVNHEQFDSIDHRRIDRHRVRDGHGVR
jgi:hypothetical protein